MLLGLTLGPQESVMADATRPEETVVLLHGLARSASSMERMADALAEAGYRPCNIDYPSRHHPVRQLALDHVLPAIRECHADSTRPVHFVTHSLGGILVRVLAAENALENIGRVVMLGPPNQGSEVVDKLGHLWPFQALNGPAGNELGTDAGSIPNQLGPPTFEFGVIAGTRSINLLLSLLIPGEDDGKVSVARAQLAGMSDFLTTPATHPLMMRKREVIGQTLHFLAHGRFQR